MAGTRFVVRFHLHPRVQAAFENQRAGDGVAGIRLTLPGGAIYRFISIGGTMALDDSVYLGASDVPEPTRQIVVSAPSDAKVTRIKWALRRVDQDLRQASDAYGGAVAPEPAAKPRRREAGSAERSPTRGPSDAGSEAEEPGRHPKLRDEAPGGN